MTPGPIAFADDVELVLLRQHVRECVQFAVERRDREYTWALARAADYDGPG